MNSSPPIIGVIGGVGPYAGLDLVQKVFEQTRASTDQDHLPVALHSYPHRILDRTEYLEGRVAENPAHALAEIALGLERVGAAVVAIPCNTAHAPRIFGLIRQRLSEAGSSLKLLHLVEACVAHIQESGHGWQRIGVLSTTGTWRFGMYTQVLSQHGLTPIAPTEEMQSSLVHPAIYDLSYGIKAQSDPIHPQAKSQLLTAIQALKGAGAEAVILGCTELPLAFREGQALGLPLIDPTRALARALIREVAPEKLKPEGAQALP